MNFSEALYKMKEGKKVKNEFSNKHGYLYMFLDEEKGITIRTLNDESDEVYENLSTEELLSENWEIYEESKWKPSLGDLYYYINSNGDIKFSYYNTRSIDKRCIGNFFKTDEEADHMVEKLKVIKELRDFALENNDKNVDWRDKCTSKYFITYDFYDEEISTASYTFRNFLPFEIYFTSKEIAQKAITKIGKERLERYYFDIKEKEEIK